MVRPVYNYDGEKYGIYCKKHKLDGMINTNNKRRCEETTCSKYPSFNYTKETIPLYCNTHKKEGMINIVTKRCINCNKIPIYNYTGTNKGLYCNEHRLENMINVKDSMCIENGCTTRSNYNNDGNKKGIYCNVHKKDGMIDVKNKRCKYNNCKTRPTFNYSFNKHPLYCIVHKLDNMINVSDNKCQYIDCRIIATYNYSNLKNALYCSKHKLDTMVDIRSKLCLTSLCNTRVHSDKYEGYCLRCFIYLFPDRPVVKNYKTKERTTVEYIINEFIDKTIILDKKVTDGCSKRKPDLLIDLGDQVIICEIDENQHKRYDCSCENKRLMELSQDLSHRPIIFIRFNPDQYINKDNYMIKSCWGLNKKGLCIISKNKKKEWVDRLGILKNTIQYWIDHRTNKLIETIHLFYDEIVEDAHLK